MRGRAAAASTFGAIAVSLACFSLAWACQTLHPEAIVTVDPATVTPNSKATVQGSNMNSLSTDPTVPIRVVWLDSYANYLQQLASLPGADTFTTTITVPNAAAGSYYITAYRGTGKASPALVLIPGPSPTATPTPAAYVPAPPTVPGGAPAAGTGNPTTVGPVGTGTTAGRPASLAPSTPRVPLTAAGGGTPASAPAPPPTPTPASGPDPNAATGLAPMATPPARPPAQAAARTVVQVANTAGVGRTPLVLATIVGLLALVAGGATVEIVRRRRLTKRPQ